MRVPALPAERFEEALQREIAPVVLTANGPALIARLANAAADLFAAYLW